MHRRNEFATFDMRQVLYDLLTIIFSYILSSLVYLFIRERTVLLGHIGVMICYSVVFVLSMSFGRMYNITTFHYADRIAARTVLSSIVAGFSLSMFVFLLKQNEISRLLCFIFWILCPVMIVLQRFLRIYWLRSKVGASRQVRVVFLGDAETFERYRHYVSLTLLKTEFVDVRPLCCTAKQDPEAFGKYLAEKTPNEAIIVYRKEEDCDYELYLRICEEMGVTARLLLDMFPRPVAQRYISSIGPYPVLTYHSTSLDKVSLFVKYAADFVVAALGSVLLLPAFCAIAIAIKADSKGPAVFTQQRVGHNGKPFTMYKFRTMVADAEQQKHALQEQNKVKDGMMFKIERDPRLTKVGAFLRKTSLDELPQLWNVLRGDMSLVGTRPPTVDEVAKYKQSHWRRISIRPGITGMWQVNGRSDVVDFEEVVSLDKKYIDEWSLGMDIKLLLQTVGVVFQHKGSY